MSTETKQVVGNDRIQQFMADANTIKEDEYYVLVLDTVHGVGYYNYMNGNVTDVKRELLSNKLEGATRYEVQSQAVLLGRSLHARFRAVNGWAVYAIRENHIFSVSFIRENEPL